MTVAEFEDLIRSTGAQLRATQFDGDSVRVDLRMQKVGEIFLTAARANQMIALEWQERPGSINLSICTTDGQLLVEGRARAAPSLVVYSEPASRVWAAQWLPSSGKDMLYHIAVPLELASSLGMPVQAARRGWFEVPLDGDLAVQLKAWFDATLEQSQPSAAEGVYREATGWIETMFAGLRGRSFDVIVPSPYPRIIRALGDRCEIAKGPISVARLAGEIHVSTRTVQRAFQATFGVGAKRYLRVRQLRRAHELLRSGDCSVSSAAHAVGFPHTSRFSQEYFTHFGVYPSETIATSERSG